MTSTTAPTQDEILAGLVSGDPRFADPDAVEQVKDIIGLLPDVIGEERLGHKVNLREFLAVEVDFLRAVLETDFDKDLGDLGLTRQLYGQLIDQLESMVGDLEGVLASMGMSLAQAESSLTDQSGFNAEVTARYNAGDLTFADLVRMQPSVFLLSSG